MPTISQNRKVAVIVASVFVVIASGLLFFFGDDMAGIGTSVLSHDGGHGTEDSADHGEDSKNLEAEYRELLEDEENPIFATDAEGHFEFVETGFCSLISTKCDTLREEKTIFELINGADLPDFASAHSKLLKEKEKLEGVGPFRMLKNDHEILLLFKMMPVLDKDENVEKILYSVKDITAQAENLQEKESTEESSGSVIKYLYPRVESLKNGEGKVVYRPAE